MFINIRFGLYCCLRSISTHPVNYFLQASWCAHKWKQRMDLKCNSVQITWAIFFWPTFSWICWRFGFICSWWSYWSKLTNKNGKREMQTASCSSYCLKTFRSRTIVWSNYDLLFTLILDTYTSTELNELNASLKIYHSCHRLLVWSFDYWFIWVIFIYWFQEFRTWHLDFLKISCQISPMLFHRLGLSICSVPSPP